MAEIHKFSRSTCSYILLYGTKIKKRKKWRHHSIYCFWCIYNKNLWKCLYQHCVFGHLSACNIMRITKWFFNKFDIGNWLWFVRIFKFQLKPDNDEHYQNAFCVHFKHKSHEFTTYLSDQRLFSTKVADKNDTCISCPVHLQVVLFSRYWKWISYFPQTKNLQWMF